MGDGLKMTGAVEVIIADIMKSVSVYLITYDPDQAAGSKFRAVRNSHLKYRFPFGQWCVAAEKVGFT
jgi:hypothetical protein